MNKKKLNKIRGSSLIEYVLLIGLIGAATVTSLTSTGDSISSFFTDLSNTIGKAGKKL